MARINVASGTIFQNKLFKSMNVRYNIHNGNSLLLHVRIDYMYLLSIYTVFNIRSKEGKRVVFGSPSDFVFLFIILCGGAVCGGGG